MGFLAGWLDMLSKIMQRLIQLITKEQAYNKCQSTWFYEECLVKHLILFLDGIANLVDNGNCKCTYIFVRCLT